MLNSGCQQDATRSADDIADLVINCACQTILFSLHTFSDNNTKTLILVLVAGPSREREAVLRVCVRETCHQLLTKPDESSTLVAETLVRLKDGSLLIYTCICKRASACCLSAKTSFKMRAAGFSCSRRFSDMSCIGTVGLGAVAGRQRRRALGSDGRFPRSTLLSGAALERTHERAQAHHRHCHQVEHPR